MVVSIKDCLKLFGITIVCFCAVFVCTVFLNFYLDASELKSVPDAARKLYDAQIATAKFSCGISGGFLAAIAVVMLVFYIRLYISRNAVRLGILKAMGYSNAETALKFWVFGLSAAVGAALGYGIGHALMPYVYDSLTVGGLPEIAITYHPVLLILLVIVPTVVYAILSCLFAYIALKKPLSVLLRGKTEKVKVGRKENSDRPFLKDMFFKSVSTRKTLTFFVAFGAFCFSAMVQMAFSMMNVTDTSLAWIILIIGLIVAVVTLFMAVSAFFNANAGNVSLMKAFGYRSGECALAVFGGSAPFAALGFALGTVYQYVLLKVMVNYIFRDVEGVAAYSFDAPLMFIALAAFVAFYAAVMLLYFTRLKHMTVKQTAE